MSMFMTRVELHSASDSDYEKLHAAMQQQGFSRTIKGGDSILYHLPTAGYYCSVYVTIEEVRTSAKQAASTTGKNYGVLVTESNGFAWFGLAPVS